MKKIPTLFQREYDEKGRVVGITSIVKDGCEDALDPEKTIMTVKWDGSCCAVCNGIFYKRFDAKATFEMHNEDGEITKIPHYKNIPDGAIPCDDPDPVTGHWPHWVPVTDSSNDKWFVAAGDIFFNTKRDSKYACLNLGLNQWQTFEAVGPHFQGNPYHLDYDILIPHGADIIDELPERSFESIRTYLDRVSVEGIVFWTKGEDPKPLCKIKRRDFGFKWP